MCTSFKNQIIFFLLIFTCIGYAQRQPDPNVGNTSLRRSGEMNGNLVRTIFINWGEIAHWPDDPSGEWPKGTGHQYVDGVALVVQAKATDNNGNTIYPLETQYREFVDRGPKDQLWGWAPLPGYFNVKGTNPAISDDPGSWPDFWPDREGGWINDKEIRNDYDDDGNGLVDDLVYWNGFFGKGEMNAEMETYFVFDDDPDEEWDFYPDPANPERRGMGLEVAARLFQWSQVLAEDVIFAIYFITNEGATTYDSTYYSFYIDWGVGGTDDSSDDTGDYDTELDIAWASDKDGFGTPRNWYPVGVAGFAFLESPGIDDDGLDNDQDGITDESRVSDGPGTWLDTEPFGVDNLVDFKRHYIRDPGPHWSNDEDGDWVDFLDINNNGIWDEGESLNDDLGKDGLGPNSFGYTGPDEGEADGLPTAGEPNFDFLDKDEADQIGLTGFRIFPVHTYELWNEKQNWEVFKSAPAPASAKVTANLGMFFSSGPFPLKPGETENYSMALLFGMNEDDLVLTKNTIQQIYNADYRFSKPPDKPRILSVTPGDKKVIITWDSRAEKSWDPFLQKHDFEGYRIYKSAEKEFLDARLITDAYGRPTYGQPVAQYDLKNEFNGLHPIHTHGAHFNMGNDTGLRHYFIDTDVKNGQTYYYAVVSYDQGLIDTSEAGDIVGLSPSECTSKIDQDIAGNISLDINTTMVMPGKPSAGFVEAGVDGGLIRETIGTGLFNVDFVLPDSVQSGREYSVEFGDTTYLHDHGSPYFMVYDITNGVHILKSDTLWIEEFTQSDIIDGFIVSAENHEAEIDYENSSYIGHTNYRIRVNLNSKFNLYNINYPADYEIHFSDTIIDTADNRLHWFPTIVETKFKVINITESLDANFDFVEYYVHDSTLTPYFENHNPDSIEAAMIWIEDPGSEIGVSTSWRFYFEADPNVSEQIPPQPGDILRLITKKPFRDNDKISFTVKSKSFSKEKAKTDLDKIAVVPNPYMAAVSWESKSAFRSGRGERKIYFTNLPPKCTIRIYTIRGYLVDTIERSSTIDVGQEAWDLISKDGQDIAYGIYIYHVSSPGIGEKIGKFAVVK